MSDAIKTWGEWIVRAIVVGLLVANLYMKQNYVSAEAYAKDKESATLVIDSIRSSIVSMDKAVSLLARQDRLIEDHEMRLRALERRP